MFDDYAHNLSKTVRLITIMTHSTLAQLVEQLTVNQRVAGSSPAGGASFYWDFRN